VATTIEAILLAVYTALEGIPATTLTIDPNLPLTRWRLREVDLDRAPIASRIRAFVVSLGPASKSVTWSSRSLRWYQGELRVRIGYVSSDEAARDPDLQALGYEGMADADTPIVVNEILYSALAALSDVKSPEYQRSDPSVGTSRTHVFAIEWGEAVA
jgi:hypothetical protein